MVLLKTAVAKGGGLQWRHPALISPNWRWLASQLLSYKDNFCPGRPFSNIIKESRDLTLSVQDVAGYSSSASSPKGEDPVIDQADVTSPPPPPLPPPHQQLPPQHIGFIGLGNMGSRMAMNLMKHGHSLTVYDRNVLAMDSLIEKGAKEAKDPESLADSSDIIISMLPSSPQVEDVYLGPSGVLRQTHGYVGIRPRLLIDASTIDPMTSRKVFDSLSKCRLKEGVEPVDPFFPHPLLIDSPVSGGVLGAEAGTLTFMVGGDPLGVAAAEPILSCMGSSIVHCGKLGSGQVAKLCNNLALAIEMAGVSEALALGQRLGVDPRILTQIFNTSSARCWSSDTYNPCPGVMETVPSSRGYNGGFATSLMAKDIGLALAASKEVGAVIPMGAKVLELYMRMLDSAASNKDFSSIYLHIYGGQPATPQPATTAPAEPTVVEKAG